MKSFKQFLNSTIEISGNTEKLLFETLAALSAAQIIHHTSHWQEKGKNFYGNHLLFERLYKSLDDEIDTLGEKLVAYFGTTIVDPTSLSNQVADWTKQWNIGKPLQNSTKTEEDLQKIFHTVYDKLKDKKEITLGLDDFLMSMADDHETNLYLLNQVQEN